MPRELKVHLVMRGGINLCGGQGRRRTVDFIQSTCKNCRTQYRGHKNEFNKSWNAYKSANPTILIPPVFDMEKSTHQYMKMTLAKFHRPAFDIKIDFTKLAKDIKKAGEDMEKSMNRIKARQKARKGHCKNCGKKIRTMCFLGTDHCSENCRKDLLEKGETNES